MLLKTKNKTICFDIDNVICKTKNNNYSKSKPIKKNIAFINSLYKKNYEIKLFTARFMGRSNDDQNIAQKKSRSLTTRQLKKWKVCYHKIFFGKPSFDIYVDDKALFFKKNWIKELKKNVNKN